MKKICFLLLIISIASVSMTEAQIRRFGFRSGLNIVKFRQSVVDNATSTTSLKTAVRPNLGLIAETGVGHFVTKFGILYSSKGTKGTVNSEKYNLNLHYLEVPIQFCVSYPIGEYINIEGGFGPYGALAFMGREKQGTVTTEEILGWDRKVDGLNGTTDPKPFFPLDCGISFGGSVVGNITEKFSLELGFNYQLGLIKISNDMPDATNPKYKNNCFTISIAALFNNSKPKASKEEEEPTFIPEGY